jgi:hypothetical protein
VRPGLQNLGVTIFGRSAGYFLASQGPGKIRLDGQEIRVSWHRRLPLRVFVCPKCGQDRYKLSCVNGCGAVVMVPSVML